VSTSITRFQLVSRGARGGAVLLAGGAALGRLAGTASADPIPPADLAYVRLLVGAELLAADFYVQAVAAANSGPAVRNYLRRALLNEQEHYQAVAGILSGASITPASSADIDFTYPKGSFADEPSILKQAVELENIMMGAYLGALGGIQTNAFKTGLAEIAAAEAQHLSYFSTVRGGKPFWLSFPLALTIDQASNAMDAYTS
jgi:Ferritin-like domain